MRLALGDGNGHHLCSYPGLLNWHVRRVVLEALLEPGRGVGSGGVSWWTGSGNRAKVCLSNCSTVLLPSWHWRLSHGVLLPRNVAPPIGFQFWFRAMLERLLSFGGGPAACMDGTRNAGRCRVGALVPFFGLRSFYPTHRKYASEQTTKLHAVALAV